KLDVERHNTSTHLYTLSLHDALPISSRAARLARRRVHRQRLERQAHAQAHGHVERVPSIVGRLQGESRARPRQQLARPAEPLAQDRKSTRLNSSHDQISYAVFRLKI